MSFKKIEDFIIKHNLIEQDSTIILGLSGGPDSVFLFHFLLYLKTKLPFIFICAHLDHEWRKESREDVEFCRNLCKIHSIVVECKKISELPIKIKSRGSKEDVARNYRRFFFEKIKKKYGAHAIAVAHNQDDQVETFFIRLIRGTTVSGLSCMHPLQNNYVRPLLETSKQTILDYLKEKHLTYRFDATNLSRDYLRNRIRLDFLPSLQKIDARSKKNILKTIDSMQQTEAFIKGTTRAMLSKITDKNNTLNVKALLALDDIFLQRRVILEWLYFSQISFNISTKLIDEILRFLDNKKSTSHQFNTWKISKKKFQASIVKASINPHH